jgi:hypothetical protein
LGRRCEKKTPLFEPVIYDNEDFYQDRLGTNIGKVEKRVAFFAGTTEHRKRKSHEVLGMTAVLIDTTFFQVREEKRKNAAAFLCAILLL